MGIVIKFIVFIGTLFLFNKTEKPFLCAGFYCGAYLLFGFALNYSFIGMLIPLAIVFALLILYYYLLNVFSGSILYWVILMAGGLIVFL